jgi:hypothetical protein
MNMAHLFATHFIIINIRVIIKGKALIKYSCMERLCPPFDTGSIYTYDIWSFQKPGARASGLLKTSLMISCS